MKPSTILTSETSFAAPGSFLLGDTRFVAGQNSEYRQLNYRPIERTLARNALGMPTMEYQVLINDDFLHMDAVLTVLPVLMETLGKEHKARLIFTGGFMDMPDPQLNDGMGKLENYLQQNSKQWKWTIVGRKSEQVMRYYYSAANLVVLSLHQQTDKLCSLIESLFSSMRPNYAGHI